MPARILALALSLAAGLAGCTEYTDSYLGRRDTLALSAGNAMRANAAIHTIDPWPAASQNTALTYDGQRAARVIERYRTRSFDGENADKAPGAIQLQVAR